MAVWKQEMWYSRQEVVTRPADQSQPCRLRGSRKSLRKKWRKSRKIARRTQDVRSRARGAQGRARASCACAYAYVTEHKSAFFLSGVSHFLFSYRHLPPDLAHNYANPLCEPFHRGKVLFWCATSNSWCGIVSHFNDLVNRYSFY